MVALYTRQPGDEIKAADVNQFVTLLTGGAGVEQPVSLTRVSDVASPSLILKHLNASGITQKWLNSAGVSLGEFDYRGLRVNQLAVGATIQAGGQPLLVSGSTADQTYQLASMEYGNHYVGTGDVSTLRLIAALEPGATDMQHRAGEFHTMINSSASATSNREGILVSLQGSKSSGSATGIIHNTIWCQSTAANWPSHITTGSAQRMDNHLFLGYDGDGVNFYIRCIGTAGAGTPEHFRVDGVNGTMETRAMKPFVTTSHDIGTSSLLYNDVFAVRGLWGLGAVGTPAWTFSGDTNTGIFQPAASADNFSIGTGGAEALRITAAQLLDIRSAGSFVALGGGAAPTLGTIGGTGPAVAAQNKWLKILEAGTADFIPVWR